MFNQSAPLDVEAVEEPKEYVGRHRVPDVVRDDQPQLGEVVQLGR
ncbi:hypothetical protein [Mycobacteroides abscessus]|nr:hypothetical protein [Mycobacteroides abscessus]CPW71654.1 Uncharacterised protein [Mycobacteroides abscessus]SKF62125.1 Uncharacterised protein [Mycobacteroides abscessus subsp. bolletii]SKH91592.1 Uncharacterised protein [Mycobacteroides abscessus subsp. bolletii]